MPCINKIQEFIKQISSELTDLGLEGFAHYYYCNNFGRIKRTLKQYIDEL